jgi:hypothetical protein
MGTTIDITGKIFGRWTVLKRAANTKQGQAQWYCRCECGNEKTLKSILIRRGISRSCGCLKSEVVIARSTKHGHATNGISPTYHSWVGMIARCTNPRHTSYARYGGRGITVCKRWYNFANFLADMGEKPKDRSIERRNYNKNYEKANCYWATASEQASNKRNNRLLTAGGETKTLSEWARKLGMSPATIADRLKHGWNESDAVTVAKASFSRSG